MIVRISARVLQDPIWYPVLDVIAAFFALPDCCHGFDIAQLSQIAKSAWLQAPTPARANTLQLLKGHAKALSYSQLSNGVVLTIDETAPLAGRSPQRTEIEVHPLGALTFLCLPFYLIVEDESSDGAFILWMARLLGRDSIIRLYRSGRLAFRHAGGKGQFVKSARSLSYGTWPRAEKPIFAFRSRVGGLMDSDERFPGENPNEETIKQLSPHVVFAQQLNRRAIENYVPEKYFRARFGASRRAAIDAFFRMSAVQQIHFPMKRGFPDPATPGSAQSLAAFNGDQSRPLNERALFNGVSLPDWSLLAGGFGDRISDVYKDEAYRCTPNEPNQLSAGARSEINLFLSTLIHYL